MRKVIIVLMTLILALSLCGCDGKVVERDENNRPLKKVYYDKAGEVQEEITYTYYDSGNVRTQRKYYPQVNDQYTPNIIEIENSDDGLCQTVKQYYLDRLAQEEYTEIYANEADNWHWELDQVKWRKCVFKAYYRDGDNTHIEYEYTDDHTYVKKTYRPDGTLELEEVYRWCEAHEIWDDKISKTYYDENGDPIE